MARFDVYALADGGTLVLDVQSDLLEGLNTRVTIPLIPLAEWGKPGARLNPVFSLDDGDYVLATQFITAVTATALRKPVANLGHEHTAVTNALDKLFQGV